MNVKLFVKSLVLVVGVLFTAAGVARAAPDAPQDDELASPKLRIAWEDFKKLYDEGKAVVVDVRGKDAYEAGHIPGARSIPLAEVERHANELKKLHKPIVLYCA